MFLYSSCINIGVDRAGGRAGKWWVPAIPDHERQASVPCVRVVSRGTVFYLDGSWRGLAGHEAVPAQMDWVVCFGHTAHSSSRRASVRRSRALLISLRVCRVGLTPSRCMYKQGARQRLFVMLLVEYDRTKRFGGMSV